LPLSLLVVIPEGDLLLPLLLPVTPTSLSLPDLQRVFAVCVPSSSAVILSLLPVLLLIQAQ
jgi:hypothetical protein